MKQKLFFLLTLTLLILPLLARENTVRCATNRRSKSYKFSIPSDCGEGKTTIKSEYNPGDIFFIPVVFHVLYGSDGTGRLTEEKVREQIELLNQDFRALAGTKGEAGFDCGIEFFLAEEDPAGNATSGITYTQNDLWFDDETDAVRTQFGRQLGWDPDRYLNIYSTAGWGYLGYVVNMPWMGGSDPADEGVVLAHYAVGYNNDSGDDFSGQTATHEVGHYLGLMHTFGWGEGNCPTGNCYEDGDWICDTEDHAEPNGSCTETDSCGSRDPIHNYMNYTMDPCMTQFSMEQANRMRCSLVSYRAELIQTGGGTAPNHFTRWIPHITRNGGGFKTTLMVRNTSSSATSISFHSFDSSGTQGEQAEIKLGPNEIKMMNANDLFSTQPSHLGISGGGNCLITAGYRDAMGTGATAHIPESETSTKLFSFYPGESSVFDGIAVINLGDKNCQVVLETLNQSSGVLKRKVLSSDLAPKGKLLTTLDDLNLGSSDILVKITTSEQVMPLILRGSRPGTSPAFLYQTVPNLK